MLFIIRVNIYSLLFAKEFFLNIKISLRPLLGI